MTTENTTPKRVTTPGGKLTPGDVIHFRKAVTAFGDVRVRGASLKLTADMIERSVSADGTSWLDRVDDPDGRIGRGEWPATEPRWVYGDPEWQAERESARRRAWAVSDPEERAAARAEVQRVYGDGPTTSQSVDIAEHYTERQAREQAERRARGLVDRTR
ncbi:hypothetical protein [Microbacterium sp.]|uniref:hypothetical protein n=1 Tax=Microbacterium sp. TaxID=51671 RepID=UPI0039E240A6